MAHKEKRRFSLDKGNMDAFFKLPTGSRILYYELGLRANERGYLKNPWYVLKQTGCSEEELDLLIENQYVSIVKNGMIVHIK